MMGVSGLRDAFNSVSEPDYTCSLASLTYERKNNTEFQILYFRVRSAADGTEIVVTSDDIPPQGDLTAACRAAAQKLLDQGIPSQ